MRPTLHLALLSGCAAGLLAGLPPADSARPAPAGPRPLDHYSCEIRTVTEQGESRETLAVKKASIQKVWHRGGAYRIETRRPGTPPGTPGTTVVRVNNGDGSGTEFFWAQPGRKPGEPPQVQISLETVLWNHYRKDPARYMELHGLPTSPPSGNLLPVFENRVRTPSGRPVNPTVKKEELPKPEWVDGKKCRVYILRYQELTDPATRTADPGSRFTQRHSVWTEGNILLRSELLHEKPGASPPGTPFLRTTTTVSNLVLRPPIPASRFQAPAGSIYEVFAELPIRLPPGAKRRVLPGSGFVFEGPPPGPRRLPRLPPDLAAPPAKPR